MSSHVSFISYCNKTYNYSTRTTHKKYSIVSICSTALQAYIIYCLYMGTSSISGPGWLNELGSCIT